MPAFAAISPDKLSRLIGTSSCPVIIDVRPETDKLVPTSAARSAETMSEWAPAFVGQQVVVLCVHGGSRSSGVAAYLRSEGVHAEILEGGFEAWCAAGLPLIDASKLPRANEDERTVWVTRARPKVDRIACPWLIRRFVDPMAMFLFVPAANVAEVADQLGATPFDIEGVFWSHRGELCTFDVMVEELGLGVFDGLTRLAAIVRGADTAHPEIAPQAAGLLAASLGLSRMHGDDLAQLEDGMILYDAFYRWCRDAVDETHDWVAHTPRRRGK
jgi:rhodanese-related sulfurtransferase